MKAIIVAGGRGSRLGTVTASLPKPLVPIGGQPLLAHQLQQLRQAGVSEVIVSTHYLAEQIETFVRSSSFDLAIRCVRERQPRGTAGAVKDSAHDWTEDFVVMYGDTMFAMDLPRLQRWHRAHQAECTVVVHPNDHPADSDLVALDPDGKVTAWYPKPRSEGSYLRNLVNAGVYMMQPSFLRHIPDRGEVDFGRTILPAAVAGGGVWGYVTAEYLKDMGTPPRLAQVERDYVRGLISQRPRPAVFVDRDGVVNEDIPYIHRLEDVHVLPRVPEAIRQLNQAGYLVMVVTNQPVVARGLCTEADVRRIHDKLETILGEHGAYLDAIYVCPHHPDRGFPGENVAYKMTCQCRKPAIGLIEQAQREFSIDMSRSVMMGDGERDIECGKNAGLLTIGIGKITAWGVQPDYHYSDLYEAVQYILSQPEIGEHANNHVIETSRFK
jgi:histidinol-phosphate phosphatase family protein